MISYKTGLNSLLVQEFLGIKGWTETHLFVSESHSQYDVNISELLRQVYVYRPFFSRGKLKGVQNFNNSEKLHCTSVVQPFTSKDIG